MYDINMIKEFELTEEKVAQIFQDGVCSEAEVYLGETVDVILQLTQRIHESALYKRFVERVGAEHGRDADEFLISFVCSAVSTLTETFKDRELEKGEA